MADFTYSRGLHHLGAGCYAWMQPDGGWGWSNAGLVAGSDASVLIDTLFDLPNTADMLSAMDDVTADRPITTVINTHSDGDHYFGNQLLAERGAEIIASEAAAQLMTQESVDDLAGMTELDGAVGDFARTIMGPFDFRGIVSTGPTQTFTDAHTLEVGGREVHLIQVGPAHTSGDTLVHVPDAKTLYAGDILFIGGTPIVWAGPPERWVAACERILDMDLVVIVPGHGPVTDKSGVEQVRDYLTYVIAEATKRFEDGLDLDAAIQSLAHGRYSDVPEHGRVAQNVASVYRTLDADAVALTRGDIFARMAALDGFTADREEIR